MLKKRKIAKDVNIEILKVLQNIQETLNRLNPQTVNISNIGSQNHISESQSPAIAASDYRLSEKEIELRERIMSLDQSKLSGSGEVETEEGVAADLENQLDELEKFT